MSSSFLPSTLLALLAAVALVLGSALPNAPLLRAHLFYQRLSLLIGFSAGLMLATALHDLLPEAMEAGGARAMWGAGVGFLALYLAERMTHFHACRHRNCEVDVEAENGHEHEHQHEHVHVHEHRHEPSTLPASLSPTNVPPTHSVHPHHGHADTMALVGMGIHNFADGLTTAAAFSISSVVGLVVILAIVLHQMAAGVSLGAIMLRAGRDHRRILLSTAFIASFIVWGAVFYHLVVPVNMGTQGIILGLAGGSFLYVAACDLLPEAHAEDEGWSITAATLVGYLFAFGVQALLAPHRS
jgi:zinc transporter ZupT